MLYWRSVRSVEDWAAMMLMKEDHGNAVETKSSRAVYCCTPR